MAANRSIVVVEISRTREKICCYAVENLLINRSEAEGGFHFELTSKACGMMHVQSFSLSEALSVAFQKRHKADRLIIDFSYATEPHESLVTFQLFFYLSSFCFSFRDCHNASAISRF